jgi:hypothetical protein
MCQIRNLLTQTPEEHLVVTDRSPKVHNAVLATPTPRRSAIAFQARHPIGRTPEMDIARRFPAAEQPEQCADVGLSNKKLRARPESGRALGTRTVYRCIDTDGGAHQRDARGHDQPGASFGELLAGSVSAASAPELQPAHRVRAVEDHLEARVSSGDLYGSARRAVDADGLSRHTTSMPISMGFSNSVRAGLRR